MLPHVLERCSSSIETLEQSRRPNLSAAQRRAVLGAVAAVLMLTWLLTLVLVVSAWESLKEPKRPTDSSGLSCVIWPDNLASRAIAYARSLPFFGGAAIFVFDSKHLHEHASVGGAVLVASVRFLGPALVVNLIATLFFWIPSFFGNLLFCEEKPSTRVWIAFAFYLVYYFLFKAAKAKYEARAARQAAQAEGVSPSAQDPGDVELQEIIPVSF